MAWARAPSGRPPLLSRVVLDSVVAESNSPWDRSRHLGAVVHTRRDCSFERGEESSGSVFCNRRDRSTFGTGDNIAATYISENFGSLPHKYQEFQPEEPGWAAT